MYINVRCFVTLIRGLWLFIISLNSKIPSWRLSEIKGSSDEMMKLCVMVSFCLMRSRVCIFLLTRILVKIISKKFQLFCAKTFGDSEKYCHLSMRAAKGIFFIKLIMLLRAYSYTLKISRNTEIKYPFHFKVSLNVLNTFHASCLSAFNSPSLQLATLKF